MGAKSKKKHTKNYSIKTLKQKLNPKNDLHKHKYKDKNLISIYSDVDKSES